MRCVNINEFKTRASKYLVKEDNIVLTRYGKPLAVITPIKDDSIESIFFRIRSILDESKVTKDDLLAALEEVRKEIYI